MAEIVACSLFTPFNLLPYHENRTVLSHYIIYSSQSVIFEALEWMRTSVFIYADMCVYISSKWRYTSKSNFKQKEFTLPYLFSV